jgi:hypothetical protein
MAGAPISGAVEPLLSADRIGARVGRSWGARSPATTPACRSRWWGKGGFVFLADLARPIDLPLEIDFLRASSYVGARSTG